MNVVWIVTRFIDYINTRPMTTFNYSAIANLHTVQFTTAHAKSFSLLCLHQSFWQWRFFSFCTHFITRWFSIVPTKSSLHTLPYNWLQLESSRVLCYDRQLVGQPLLEWSTHLGLTIKFLLLSDSCVFVDVGSFLWREDGSDVYNYCWPSPAQSFSGLSPLRLVAIFYCLRFETSLFVASYDSQGYGGGIRSRLHAGYCLCFHLESAGVFVIKSLCTDHVENIVSNSTSIVARELI
jgi:hypothetical protein